MSSLRDGTDHIDSRDHNSGVKHLEEIKAAGLETPAVNQIEVRVG